MNRCVICGKFRPWELLRDWFYQPDSPFGPEIIELACVPCMEKEGRTVETPR